MSTGLYAEVFEAKPNEWFYLIQESKEDEWDDVDCIASFATDDEAYKHLEREHANPGNFNDMTYADLQESGELEEYQKYAARSKKPKQNLLD